MDEIKTTSGRVVGNWNGERAQDLMAELKRIKTLLAAERAGDTLDSRAMPHREQLHPDLLDFRAYHLWGCDKQASASWAPTPTASSPSRRFFPSP